MNKDLFGETVIPDVLLRDKFLEPPFSVLDTRAGSWQNRKRKWAALGMKSEVGRDEDLTYSGAAKGFDHYRVKEGKKAESAEQGTSIFDPALCELIYNWFCPAGGTILDPFAGGSVRGVVANYLGFDYTGIELRPEQVESNREQAATILKDRAPIYFTGDSEAVLKCLESVAFDFVFSCPPYADLEVYSDLAEDLSNMTYGAFVEKYREIIRLAVGKLKPGSFACFVVGEVRDKKGYYYDFVGDTKRAFIDAGTRLYNDAILLNVVGSASMRASKVFEASQKLTKIHQNVLIFKKV